MKKHKFHKTTGQLHKDGSATVEHHHSEGPHKNVKHAVQSLDHLHDSMQANLGAPNPGEPEADMGQHGVPQAQAAPAGIPMAPGAAPAPAPVPGV
jgi:hypothetical protein